jgi:hypothetical protein
MAELGISDSAVLIGFDPEGNCVYSAFMPLGDYWDEIHVWDSDAGVTTLRLRTVRGYLFGDSGELLQEFESTFDLATGEYETGWARHEDGTVVHGRPRF